MMKSRCVTAIAAAVLAMGAMSASAQNLLVNPSFESSSSFIDPNFNNPLGGWGTFNGAFIDSMEVAPFDGANSLKLFGTAAANPNAFVQSDSGAFQRVPVTEGTRYTAGIRALTPSFDPIVAEVPSANPAPPFAVGHNPLLLVRYLDVNGVEIEAASDQMLQLDPTILPGDTMPMPGPGFSQYDVWELANFTSTAPAGAVEAEYLILLLTFGGAEGALFVDSTSFEPAAGLATVNTFGAPSFALAGTPITLDLDVSAGDSPITAIDISLGGVVVASVDTNGGAGGMSSITLDPTDTAGFAQGSYELSVSVSSQDGTTTDSRGIVLVNFLDADGNGTAGTALDLITIIDALNAFNAIQVP